MKGERQGLYSQVEQTDVESVTGPSSRASHPKVECLSLEFAEGVTKPWSDVFHWATNNMKRKIPPHEIKCINADRKIPPHEIKCINAYQNKLGVA